MQLTIGSVVLMRSRRFISSHIFLVQASRWSKNSIGLTSD